MRFRGSLLPVLVAAAVAITMPAAARAQDAGFVIRPELRADVITGRQSAVQVGGGVQVPAGPYARFGIIGAIGLRLHEDLGAGADSRGTRNPDARLDFLGRFLLDPYRQSPFGLSVGAGLSLRAEPDDRVRPLLLVAADLEGREMGGGWTPALQVGLGGGARFGLLFRHGGRTR